MSNKSTTVFVLLATAVAQVLLTVDGTGNARITVLFYLLVVPGLAATQHMGPMGGEARALIAVAGSITLGAVVSGALVLTNLWSPEAGFEIIAGIVLVSALTSMKSESTVLAQAPRQGEPRTVS